MDHLILGGKSMVPSIDVWGTAIANHYNLLSIVQARTAWHLGLFGGDGPILETFLAAAA